MRLGTSALLALLMGTATLGMGCASQKQWTEWERHSSHFASGDHLWFSVTHPGDKVGTRVTRADLQQARRQSWWGDPVVVRPRQVSQN